MDGWVNEWMDGWMDEWMDGWVDGWVDGWMDEWMNGQMDGGQIAGCNCHYHIFNIIIMSFSFCRILALIVENTFTGIPYMAQLMIPGASSFPKFCFKNKVFLHESISIYLSIYLSVCLSVCLSIYLSMYLCMH